MKHIFFTYGDHKYENTKKRIKRQAEFFGFDKVLIYGSNDIPQVFRNKTGINFNSRGGGYWIWKAYLFKKVLDETDYNDVIVYCDAGCTIQATGKVKYNSYVKKLQESEHSILSFRMENHETYKYTKRDVIEYFKILRYNPLFHECQLMNTVAMFIKTKYTESLINEYYNIALNEPQLFTDRYVKNNQERFIDHRHDQSIFSILRYKHGSVIVNDRTHAPNFRTLINEPFLATRIRG